MKSERQREREGERAREITRIIISICSFYYHVTTRECLRFRVKCNTERKVYREGNAVKEKPISMVQLSP